MPLPNEIVHECTYACLRACLRVDGSGGGGVVRAAQWSKYRRVPCKLLLHVVLVITLTIHTVRFVDVVRGA